MRRYLAFQGSDYYPRGGIGDFVGSADHLRDAAILAQSPMFHLTEEGTPPDRWHVIDTYRDDRDVIDGPVDARSRS